MRKINGHRQHSPYLTDSAWLAVTRLEVASDSHLVIGLGKDASRKLVRVKAAILQTISPLFNVMLGQLVNQLVRLHGKVI